MYSVNNIVTTTFDKTVLLRKIISIAAHKIYMEMRFCFLFHVPKKFILNLKQKFIAMGNGCFETKKDPFQFFC